MSPSPNLSPLSAEERRQVQSWLADFDRSWDAGRLAAFVRKLPAPGNPLRVLILGALAEADLRRQWQQGRRVLVETYLQAYPELAAVGAVLASLVEAEWQVRRQRGWPGDAAEYARRFPHLAEELRGRLADRAAATPGPDQPTQATRSLRDGTLASARPGEAPRLPEQFGRYRILKQLGQGGMGAVYLAFDTHLARPVALKVPHFAGTRDAEALSRFLREARAAAVLRHPNICPVHDVGEQSGIPFVTMAYIEGQSLADKLADKTQKGRRLSRQAIATVVRKLALALEESHRRGVIHRDLKPSNILIDKRNEPIVMDFGLARRVGKEDARLTRVGSLLGTPAYMAPEQIDGDPDAVGRAADVYSLGVVLYEMLTGQVPFQGSTAAVLGQVLTAAPVRPSALRPGLDATLEGICLKAMAKRPAERFPSMAALAAALDDYAKAGTRSGPVPELVLAEEALVVKPVRPAPPVVRPAEVIPVVGRAAPAPVRDGARKKPPRGAQRAGPRPRRRWRAVLVGGAAGAVVLAALVAYGPQLLRRVAGGSYTIQIKEAAQGARRLVEEREVVWLKGTTRNREDKEREGKEQETKATFVYRETVLEAAAGERRPARLSRAYEKAEVTQDGKVETLGFAGKTVLIEPEKGKQYFFRVEGDKGMSSADAAYFRREFQANGQDLLHAPGTCLPGRPVRLNEVWQVKLEPFTLFLKTHDLDLELDPDTSSATGKLVRVHHEDGALFGVMELRLEGVPRSLRSRKDVIDLEPGGNVTVAVTWDGCIDGTSATATMTVNMEGRLQARIPSRKNSPQPRLVDFEIRCDIVRHARELPGAPGQPASLRRKDK